VALALALASALASALAVVLGLAPASAQTSGMVRLTNYFHRNPPTGSPRCRSRTE